MMREQQKRQRLKSASKARAEGRVLGAGVMQRALHATALPASELFGHRLFRDIAGWL